VTTQGKRRTSRGGRLAASLALGAAAVLGIAGCTAGAAGRQASVNSPASPGDAFIPALTLAEAQQAYQTYITVSDRAAAAGSRKLALSVVNGVQAAQVDTQYTLAAAAKARPPYARYAYVAPAYYLPEPAPSGDPQYFVVSVQRTPVSAAGAATASAAAVPAGVPRSDLAAGVALPARAQVLMLFEQAAEGGAWVLASTSQLMPGQTIPKLATDSRGYVHIQPLNTAGTGQVVRPALTGPLQAAVVDDGPASPASSVVAGGPLTTGMYEAARASARGFSAPPGDDYQWVLEGSNYGRLALATADGGALVLYGMYLRTTVQTPSVTAQVVPLVPGPAITIPAFIKPLLPKRRHQARNRLIAEDVLSFVAIDPPAPAQGAATPKIQVIAIGGGVRYADAS
jgi:hypothetical protein